MAGIGEDQRVAGGRPGQEIVIGGADRGLARLRIGEEDDPVGARPFEGRGDVAGIGDGAVQPGE